MIQAFEIVVPTDRSRIRGRLITPDNMEPPFKTVVMLTGDGPKGTKSLSWTNLPPKLLASGIASFLFDFRGLGYSDGDRRTLTITKGIEDFRRAMEFLASEPLVDTQRIGALASSFGATVLLATPDLANTFKAIGLKSPAAFLPDAYLAEVGSELFDRWASTGYLDENGYSFEVLTDALKYNTYATAQQICVPSLTTHGNMDQTVPIIQSKYLHQCLGARKQLEIFDGVGHGYSEDDAWDKMATLFVKWFDSEL